MIFPNYYPDFTCIADACRHSCCIGWEIDIDDETAARYRALPGEAGERLRRSIAGDPPHFVLDAEERCPCLTGEGLCALILTYGEDALCQICRDHPRFRHFWTGRTEIGLGACCEEAARLILAQEAPFALLSDGTGDDAVPEDADERAVFDLRAACHDAVNAAATSEAAEAAVLALAGVTLPERTFPEWAAWYRDLERLDDAWTAALDTLAAWDGDDRAFAAHIAPRDAEYRRMLHYFLFRHLPAALDDGDAAGKAAFAVLSARMLRALGAAQYAARGEFTFADQVELFRMYSAEVEYSEENLDAVYAGVWE